MDQLGVAAGSHYPLKALTAFAGAAERAGLHSCWLTEGMGKDSFTQLTAMALGTQRTALGTGIVTIFSRSPLLIAMTAAGVDEASNGRLLLGLGSGHRGPISLSHGVPFSSPLERMRDYVTIIKALLRGETVTHQGKAYSVANARIGFPPVRRQVPVYVAALGPKMSEVAGEVADGVLFYLMTPAYLSGLVEHLHTGASRAGRRPNEVSIACYIMASLADSRGEQTLRRSISRYATLPFYATMLRECGFAEQVERINRAFEARDMAAAGRAVSDGMLEGLTVTSAAGWRQRVDSYRRVGAELPVLFLQLPEGVAPAEAVEAFS
ncbi:MAG: LLM class flavin-dependent oxidoreductase [Chloroflexi bacterium]|nr:LLM class flavin-dependent oxidoreductase [Chloroflexota bacterium]